MTHADSSTAIRIGRGLLVALSAWWSLRLITGMSDRCFLDLVNLPFHEAGHLFLTPLGQTMHFLGGSIGQLAVPALLTGYFLLRQHNPFAAAFCFWWFGENFVNIAVYMADARTMALPLVGGGVHDWNELFYTFNLLDEPSVRAVSGTTHALGSVLMLAGLAWMGFFLLPWQRQRPIVDRLPESLRILAG